MVLNRNEDLPSTSNLRLFPHDLSSFTAAASLRALRAVRSTQPSRPPAAAPARLFLLLGPSTAAATNNNHHAATTERKQHRSGRSGRSDEKRTHPGRKGRAACRVGRGVQGAVPERGAAVDGDDYRAADPAGDELLSL